MGVMTVLSLSRARHGHARGSDKRVGTRRAHADGQACAHRHCSVAWAMSLHCLEKWNFRRGI
eukprot:11202359-Lingulodinium_polyedra.AAC.1